MSNARRFIQERFPHASGFTMFHLADVEELMQAYREDLRQQLAAVQAESQEWRNRAQDKTRLWRQAMDEKEAAQAEARAITMRAENAEAAIVQVEAELTQARASNTHAGLRAAFQKQAARANALEAENQRLREALRKIADGQEQPTPYGTTEVFDLHAGEAAEIAQKVLSKPAELKSQDSGLPLMSRATAAKMIGPNFAECLVRVTLDGVQYRVADTDEHGLEVIERTPDMPKAAEYQIYAGTHYGYSNHYHEGMRVQGWQRIEDYNAHAQQPEDDLDRYDFPVEEIFKPLPPHEWEAVKNFLPPYGDDDDDEEPAQREGS